MLFNLLLTAYLIGYMIALGITIAFQAEEIINKQYWHVVLEIMFIPLFSWIIIGIQLASIDYGNRY